MSGLARHHWESWCHGLYVPGAKHPKLSQLPKPFWIFLTPSQPEVFWHVLDPRFLYVQLASLPAASQESGWSVGIFISLADSSMPWNWRKRTHQLGMTSVVSDHRLGQLATSRLKIGSPHLQRVGWEPDRSSHPPFERWLRPGWLFETSSVVWGPARWSFGS